MNKRISLVLPVSPFFRSRLGGGRADMSALAVLDPDKALWVMPRATKRPMLGLGTDRSIIADRESVHFPLSLTLGMATRKLVVHHII